MFTGFQAVIAFIGLVLVITVVISTVAWFRLRGKRVITCPESKTAEAVEIDALRGAMQDMFRDRPNLSLASCSRWPERQDCGQECLAQIEHSPDGCLLVAILTHWYDGKDCVYCKRSLRNIQWHDHKPGLRSPKGELIAWTDFPPQRVWDVLADHDAVCWDCLITESFRDRYPDLVTNREWERDELGEFHDERRAG
jgi:hypothetical protein